MTTSLDRPAYERELPMLRNSLTGDEFVCLNELLQDHDCSALYPQTILEGVAGRAAAAGMLSAAEWIIVRMAWHRALAPERPSSLCRQRLQGLP